MGKAPQNRNAAGPRKFQATLERMRSRLNWTIIRVPFDAATVYGMRGQINVKGEINGFAFRTCLFPTRDGGHILLVNKKMQKAAGVRPGAVAEFRLQHDTEKRVSGMPEQLKRLISSDRSLIRWCDGLNQSTRNDIAKWVGLPKSEAARSRRAEQLAERLMAVRDAEQELPADFAGCVCAQSEGAHGLGADVGGAAASASVQDFLLPNARRTRAAN
jgi:hypothetical protein